jgi:hypothetical protein
LTNTAIEGHAEILDGQHALAPGGAQTGGTKRRREQSEDDDTWTRRESEEFPGLSIDYADGVLETIAIEREWSDEAETSRGQ